MGLRVVTFADKVDDRISLLQVSCRESGLPLEVLGVGSPWKVNAIKLKLLSEYLESSRSNPDDLLLVTDSFDVLINAVADRIVETFESFNTDILFSAEANYYFREPALSYFYWKFYPRSSTYYDYLNSGSFIGRSSTILSMLEDIGSVYQIDLRDEKSLTAIRSDQYVYSRFYADCATQFFRPSYNISLDHSQKLIACTGGRMTIVKWPLASKIHSFLFFKAERALAKTLRVSSFQRISRDLTYAQGSFFNSATGTFPIIIHLPSSRENFQRLISRIKGGRSFAFSDLIFPLAALVSCIAYLYSLASLVLIKYFNKGVVAQNQIFRHSKNYGKSYDESAKKLVSLLDSKTPFSFSHFNDGELTFISKFEQGNHDPDWFGRKQHSYSTNLGELLTTAFQKKKENYFVGIPCGTCHPKLRALADKLRKSDEYTVPAMTVHHNLSLVPSMLGSLKNRKLYFVLNEFQDLYILKKLGLEVSENRIIIVPFKNSYELYDVLKHKSFEKGSVVLMMCGMLAKILTPVWFDQNPDSTFMAFGSSLDDLIQREKIKFRLFPSRFPFTRNIHKSRSFLFGYKKPCDECFDIR